MTRPASALVLAWALAVGTVRAGEAKPKAEDVGGRHLAALGRESAAAAARSFKGPCAVSAPATGRAAGALGGQFTMASTASGLPTGMQFPSPAQPGQAL